MVNGFRGTQNSLRRKKKIHSMITKNMVTEQADLGGEM